MAGLHRKVCLIRSLLVLAAFALGATAHASGTFSIEGDARGYWAEGEDPEAELDVVAVAIRKTLADRGGDRWMLAGLIEIHDDLSEVMIHDAYVRYKGPMGRWNVTAGRFQLPFSLLSGFSTSRFLYDNLSDTSVGIHSDGGVMVSGVVGDLDYGFAATQGLGVHEDPEAEGLDLFSGRVGWTFGDMGEITTGVSFLFGETHTAHPLLPRLHKDHDDSDDAHGMHGSHGEHSVDRMIIGMDGTAWFGLWLTRWEVQAGELDDKAFAGGFAMADYGLLPRLDITGAMNIAHYDSELSGNIYLGLGYRNPWFTLRGGYTYDYSETDDFHSVSIQLYRVMSWPF